jgi:N-acetylmuramoyl-L-alanine amidase
MRNIHTIIWHCAATPEGQYFDRNDIDRWHKERKFSRGAGGYIGYHFVVLLDGTVQEGRPIERVGAHVEGHNVGTIGCNYIGGVDRKGKAKDTRTPEQRERMMILTKDLLERFPKINRIAGHNEYSSKACPSFYVPGDPIGKLLGSKSTTGRVRAGAGMGFGDDDVMALSAGMSARVPTSQGSMKGRKGGR